MEFIEIIRKFRIGSFAVFDLGLAYLGIFIITPILTKLALKAHLQISKLQWIWLVIPISIIVHLIFGLKTPLVKMFLDPNNFYLLKFAIILMLFMGLKDTKITKK